jgi:hypothetical protein
MSGVAEQHVPDWILAFSRLQKHIQAALDRGGNTHSVEDVIEGIRNGQFQFWWNQDSVIVTEVVRFPRKQICNFFLAGGSLDELEPLVPVIEEWAQKRGCDGITLVGREGWTRSFLRDRGYNIVHCEMSKEF